MVKQDRKNASSIKTKIIAISQQKTYLRESETSQIFLERYYPNTQSIRDSKIQNARRLAPTDKSKTFSKKELVVKPFIKTKGSLTSDKDTIARYTRKSKILVSTPDVLWRVLDSSHTSHISRRPVADFNRKESGRNRQRAKRKPISRRIALEPKVNLGLALNPVLLVH